MPNTNKVIETQEFRLVDDSGNIRARLGMNEEEDVELSLMTLANEVKLKLLLARDGFPSITLFNATPNSEKIDISVDEKGSHVHFGGDQAQQSYMFLKNDGTSGFVLTGKDGQRKAQIIVESDGQVRPDIFPSAVP